MKLAPNGTQLQVFTTSAPGLLLPTGAAVDEFGNLFVADTHNNRIVKLPSSGMSAIVFNSDLFGPEAVVLDSAGNLLVADTGDNRIVKLAPDGSFLTLWTQPASGPALFNPTGLVLDSVGNMIVADYGNSRVVVFPISVASMVQFSFCLTTTINSSSYTSVSSGIFTTTATSYTPNGTCTVASVLSGSLYTSSNPFPVAINLVTAGALFGTTSAYPTNNFLYITASSPFAGTDEGGIGLSSIYSTFTLFDAVNVHCFQGSCGLSAQLTVQLFNSSNESESQLIPCQAPSAIVSGSLCLLSYSLPGNVDYPWSVATSLSFYYNTSFVLTNQGVGVQLINGTGTRTYINRFGASFTTTLSLAASLNNNSNLLYLGSALPVDGNGLTWNLTSSVQLPGAGPAVLYSLINVVNASGAVAEVGSSVVDGLGQAFLSSVPGFVDVIIGASNVNSLAANYASCQAPITFTNGLRQPTQPSASNGALRISYSYFISDGATYSVQGNLTITTASAFATTKDMLGNPYQTVVNVTGSRTYTYLPTQTRLTSIIHGLSQSVSVLATQRFYPYPLLSSAPGVYTMNTAPFFDADGLEFAVAPSIPANGSPSGTGTQYTASTLSIITTPNMVAVLTEGVYNNAPLLNLQTQSYTLL